MAFKKRIANCRDCGAEIVFLKTAKGRKIPINAATVADGDELFAAQEHQVHFNTCPGNPSPAQQAFPDAKAVIVMTGEAYGTKVFVEGKEITDITKFIALHEAGDQPKLEIERQTGKVVNEAMELEAIYVLPERDGG